MSSKTRNTFVYYDLNTTDKKAAASFYNGLFGWTVEEHDKSGDHSSFQNNGQGFGGLATAQGGAPAHWLGYVEVDEVDERLARLEKLGGKALMPAFDIPDVGRIAVLNDSSGATFALYAGAEHMGDWEPSRDKTGDIGWAEVASTDIQKSKAFYGEGFGWSFESMPMPNGEYIFLKKGDQTLGGLYEKPPMMPVCAWIFYVNVEDVDATVAKAKQLGGQVLIAEKIPNMVHFAMIQDPQGAVIGCAKSLA